LFKIAGKLKSPAHQSCFGQKTSDSGARRNGQGDEACNAGLEREKVLGIVKDSVCDESREHRARRKQNWSKRRATHRKNRVLPLQQDELK
jgi:hypothetical protein